MTTETITRTSVKTKLPSQWCVVFHNDDFTPMDFVMGVLVAVFRLDEDEAFDIMMSVHQHGKAKVGTYPKEIAETKVTATMDLAKQQGHPLLVVAEEI